MRSKGLRIGRSCYWVDYKDMPELDGRVETGVATPPPRLRILLCRPTRPRFPCTGVRGMPRTRDNPGLLIYMERLLKQAR